MPEQSNSLPRSPLNQAVYSQHPKDRIPVIAVDHSVRASREKFAYLQCQATAWLILLEHMEAEGVNSRDEEKIVADTLQVATRNEWSETCLVLQQNMILLRTSFSLEDELHDKVLAHLQNDNAQRVHWRVTVKMLLLESSLKLEQYRFWRQECMRETRKTCSQAIAESAFVQLGLVNDAQKRETAVWQDTKLYPARLPRKRCSLSYWLVGKRGKQPEK